MDDRKLLLASGSFVAAMLICALSYLSLQSAKTAYHDAANNLERIEALKQRILELRKQSDAAVVFGEGAEISQDVWRLRAKEAGILEEQFMGEAPISPQQIAGTEYLQEDLVIGLKQVTATQLIKFLVVVEQMESAFVPTAVSLTAIASKPGEEVWNVKLTLTRLQYAAKSS